MYGAAKNRSDGKRRPILRKVFSLLCVLSSHFLDASLRLVDVRRISGGQAAGR